MRRIWTVLGALALAIAAMARLLHAPARRFDQPPERIDGRRAGPLSLAAGTGIIRRP